MPRLLPSARVLAALLLLCSGQVASPAILPAGWTHGWDYISCSTTSMLSANFGTKKSATFNLSDPWWVPIVANAYAHVQLGDFEGSQQYNGSGTYAPVLVAEALKAANPRIKTQLYAASDRGDLSPLGTAQIDAHPDWWLRDDYGNIVWFSEPTEKQPGHPVLDPSVPGARSWFLSYRLAYFGQRAAALFDGLLVDAGGYKSRRNFSDSRNRALFRAKVSMLAEAQANLTALNNGLLLVNGGLQLKGNADPSYPDISWRDNVGAIGAGGFVEWFGAFYFDAPDGSWDAAVLGDAIEIIQNASTAGHPVILKANPGPGVATFEHRFEGDAKDFFTVTAWAGNESVPASAAGCREAMSRRLTETLALFLIVAEPNVFFSYAWFYGMEDGYIPCPPPLECGMPRAWYPEFSRPLGPPAGPANKSGTIYTRSFAHAEVFIDLASRAAARIVWTSPSVPPTSPSVPPSSARTPVVAPFAVALIVIGTLSGVVIIGLASVRCRHVRIARKSSIFTTRMHATQRRSDAVSASNPLAVAGAQSSPSS